MLTLLACWQPEPFVAPAPAQVEASDVLEGTAGAIEPGDEDQPEGDAEADPPPVPTDMEVEPWKGRTVGRPLTLVGDDGAVVTVIAEEGVAVTVLMEGAERLKVRCDGCRPPLEGWLQKRAVVR